ncbi:MAG: hypothetical protein HKO79_06230 [Desulfobacterales bacterium]|nr:hypothetical protein [Deltaproteobacteria bacterium]NNL42074.1 hypothetical protein [Desulfobacterales bacterium]
MAGLKKVNSGLLSIGMVVCLIFLITACSTLPSERNSSDSYEAIRQKNKTGPLYYDFEDVLIPRELKVDQKSSFVYNTAGFSAGVLVLKGRVELGSLISFFEKNMAKDNWLLISSFKSSRTIMLFQKQNRWCVINITEGMSTRTEIWVAPTMNEPMSGLLKQ